MDVNHTRYFLFRTRAEFDHGSARLAWRSNRGALTLAPDQQLRLPAGNPAAALDAWAVARPLALDRFGQVARLTADATAVEFNSRRKKRPPDGDSAYSPLLGEGLEPLRAPAAAPGDPASRFQDLTLGGDHRLALPFSNGAAHHGLLVFHLARRWQALCPLQSAAAPALPSPPRRAVVDGANRIWVLGSNWLQLCAGEPLPRDYRPRPERFEPVRLNPKELGPLWPEPEALPAGLAGLALCCDADRLYLLCHDGSGRQAILTRSLTEQRDTGFLRFAVGRDVPFAIDLAVAGPGRLAALAPKQAGDTDFLRRDCPVLELAGSAARLVRERYPLLSQAVPRFVASADGKLRYMADPDPGDSGPGPRPRELLTPRRPRYHSEATALLSRVLDSGSPGTVWHRIYLDAYIPPGCALEIAVRAFETPGQRTAAPLIPQPPPVWNPIPSELAFSPALAGTKPGKAGLFDILLQRRDGPMRRIVGRYLQVQVHFQGDTRQTPALHALRVYYPRFSYQEAYLPESFRQELDATVPSSGPANGADIRERVFAALEGILTPLEGRIAAMEQLVHPDTAPAGHLSWMAAALGAGLPGHWPEARQRRRVREIGLVQQWKGTLAGINLALDIATDGGVARGEAVVLENFRLRRTMATILGVSMDDSDHPLTLGTGMSGNSIVGDSLILSERDAREFLALFAENQARDNESEQVRRFFERYAHQVSVLLHGPARAKRSTVQDVLTAEMPAHLQWQIIETDHPFVLGTSPLLAVDTFLETEPGFRTISLDETYLGREGLMANPAAFSPMDLSARPD